MPGTERSLKGSSMRAGFLLAFVILSLVALVVTPMLIQRRVDTLRDVVENVGEPARTMVTQVQFALAREMSSLWGYLLTGDAEFLDQFAASLAQERTTYAQLEQHVPRLGPAVLERYVELRSLERRWRDQIAWAELTRDGAGEEGALLTEPELFETVLRAATELDRAIVQEMVGYREAVRSVERMSLLISAFLGTLAFLSALASGWLGRRIRVLAHEAEVRTEVSEQALMETRKAIAERNRLLRGITHDVKNPLGAADAYAQLLLAVGSTSLSPKEQGWVVRMRRSIHAALGIINELLDLSRVESGEIVIERRPLDLAEVVQEAVEDHEGLARAAGHRMAVRLTDVPEHVYSDPNHLRRILDNLISNAIKHGGRHGYITVRVDSPPPGSIPKVGEWVRVRVSDTGHGIPADEREAIFTEFHRLAGTTADGHGLGLAISRRIARALGGDITVESVVGRGATFTLWVPIRAATDFHSPEMPSWAVRNS